VSPHLVLEISSAAAAAAITAIVAILYWLFDAPLLRIVYERAAHKTGQPCNDLFNVILTAAEDFP